MGGSQASVFRKRGFRQAVPVDFSAPLLQGRELQEAAPALIQEQVALAMLLVAVHLKGLDSRAL